MAFNAETIKVEGLREFQRSIKRVDSDLPKALRIAFNKVAQLVVDDAKPRVPVRSGKAASTVKARSTQTSARVVSGGDKAPYFPWLDFGGTVGKGHKKGKNQGSVKRPFLKGGRYIWRSFAKNRGEVYESFDGAIADIAKQAGLDVTSTRG